MTPKDFFRVVIKIIGILLFIEGVVIASFNSIQYSSFLEPISIIIYAIIVFVLFLIIFYVFFVKTEILIRLFKLDMGFDEEKFNFRNIEAKYIVEISCVIIGLYFILATLPSVVYNLFEYFKGQVSVQDSPFSGLNYNYGNIIYIDYLTLIISVILIIQRKTISKWLTNNKDNA